MKKKVYHFEVEFTNKKVPKIGQVVQIGWIDSPDEYAIVIGKQFSGHMVDLLTDAGERRVGVDQILKFGRVVKPKELKKHFQNLFANELF